MNKTVINQYIEEAANIEELYFTLLKQIVIIKKESIAAPVIIVPNRRYAILTWEQKELLREIRKKYEIWFEVCRQIVSEYSDKTDIFEEQYEYVMEFFSFPKERRGGIKSKFVDEFDIQVNILNTIVPIIELKEKSFKQMITGDLIHSELEQAEILYTYEFIRPAGVIAGIALERYLKTVCELNDIELDSNATLNPIATKLYKSDKVPLFDVTFLKSIEYLTSIRNKCSHPKVEPKKHEVRELLDNTKKITFIGLL